MNDYLKDDELYHFGVKGMKWGVRRYQNKDGSLTPAGKKKALINDYKKVGSSKRLQRFHGSDMKYESRIENKTANAISRLERNDDNPGYTAKQRVKDYNTAIRGLNNLKGRKVTDSYYDVDEIRDNNKKITKLKDKKPSKKILRKINQLTTDNDLMTSRMSEVSKKYSAYEEAANQLINRMSNDSLVVYTTRYRTLARTGGDSGYEISGTDYKVRASTKRRAKRSKYTDSKHKKQYDTKVSKYMAVYY